MRRFAVCLSMLLPLVAWSAEPLSAEDGLQLIQEQQQEMRSDIDAGRADGLTKRQVNAIRKAQVEVFAVTEGKSRLDQLTVEEQVRVENALERINAEVQNTRSARDGQNVCWRERVSGTKVNVTRCGTEAEMREAREGARDYLERPKVCAINCG